MIEWLSRVEPHRPFLEVDGRVCSYGETLDEVAAMLTDRPRLVQTSLTPDSVFDVIAGISGGGATVVGRDARTTEPGESDLVVFTSGSTGPPKGVRLSMLNLTAAAASSANHLGHGPDDCWLLAMPLHHVGGLSILIRQAYTGGSIRMLPGFEPARFAAALRSGVTMASVVPTMLIRLLDHGPYDGLRAVLVGGGPIPDGLLEKASAVGLPVLPTYGLTETFGQVATLRPGSPLAYRAHPLPGVEFRIGDGGQIAIKGPQVSSGYLGTPDRPGPWFVTNDVGEIDEEGAISVLGRADAVIVTGGENVSPERVEAVLRQHPQIEEVMVVGLADVEWGQLVACLYVGKPGDYAGWAAERLPGFMVPKRWKAVAAIPKTALGKPDRDAARRLVE